MHKRSVTSSPARRPPSDGRSSADAKRFGRPTAAHNGNRVVDLLAMFERTRSVNGQTKRRLASTIVSAFVNDPSAGSPTETLLRLLLPPKHVFCISSRARTDCCQPVRLNPTCSRYVPVGSSDGRCVQRAGT